MTEDLKRLKIVNPRYANYNGYLGIAEFVGGVSVKAHPVSVRRRLAAAMQMVEIDDVGAESAASPADVLAERGRSTPAPIIAEAKRQTEAGKQNENLEQTLKGNTPPDIVRNRADLEAVADKQGIVGLREIGAKWGVKHRNINDLMNLILRAQSEYLESRNFKTKAIEDAVKEAEAKDQAELETQRAAREETLRIIRERADSLKKLGRPKKAKE